MLWADVARHGLDDFGKGLMRGRWSAGLVVCWSLGTLAFRKCVFPWRGFRQATVKGQVVMSGHIVRGTGSDAL